MTTELHREAQQRALEMELMFVRSKRKRSALRRRIRLLGPSWYAPSPIYSRVLNRTFRLLGQNHPKAIGLNRPRKPLKSKPRIVIRRSGLRTYKYSVVGFYSETLAQGSCVGTRRQTMLMANQARSRAVCLAGGIAAA